VGVPAITDTRDGIHATVAWYREQRWLS